MDLNKKILLILKESDNKRIIKEDEVHYFGPDREMEMRAADAEMHPRIKAFKNAESFKSAIVKYVLKTTEAALIKPIKVKPMNVKMLQVFYKGNTDDVTNALQQPLKRFNSIYGVNVTISELTENSFILSY
jgi:hypothetical protein